MPATTRKRLRTEPSVQPLPKGGAEISGFHLSDLMVPSSSNKESAGLENVVPEPTAEFMRKALKEHGLLLLRDQQPSDRISSELVAFATVFSSSLFDPDKTIHFTPDGGGKPGLPMVRALGTIKDAKLSKIGYEWHVDSTDLTILYCAKAPTHGAETLFANAVRMYDDLTPAQQRLAESLQCVYSARYTAGGPAWLDADYGLRMNATGTRLLRPALSQKADWELGASPPLPAVVDVDGKRALQLSPKNLDHCVGYSHEASQAMAEELLLAGLGPTRTSPLDEDSLIPTKPTRYGPAVYSHKWMAGDLILWDNGHFAHSTTPVDFYRGERYMLQIMFSCERVDSSGAGRFMNPIGGCVRSYFITGSS